MRHKSLTYILYVKRYKLNSDFNMQSHRLENYKKTQRNEIEGSETGRVAQLSFLSERVAPKSS